MRHHAQVNSRAKLMHGQPTPGQVWKPQWYPHQVPCLLTLSPNHFHWTAHTGILCSRHRNGSPCAGLSVIHNLLHCAASLLHLPSVLQQQLLLLLQKFATPSNASGPGLSKEWGMVCMSGKGAPGLTCLATAYALLLCCTP